MYRMLLPTACLVALTLLGCIEKEFDVPPLSAQGETLDANATIADVKEFFQTGAFTEITADLIVDAVVVADDKGGNFYKKLVVQDETGGIELLLNKTDLYLEFENGRTVYIKTKGLYISEFNGVLQLGGAPVPDSRGNNRLGQIDNALIAESLVRGTFAGIPAPKKVSIIELGPANVSTLVQVCDVQFTANDTTGTLADVANQGTLNKLLEDCNANTLIVRTSGFADVGRVGVPDGKGCITGVYGVFGRDRQLFIREAFDLDLGGERCGGGGAAGAKTLTLRQVRNLFSGAAVNLPSGQGVQGVVISSAESGTTVNRNLILQDGDAGITVRFAAPHAFKLGDELFLDVSGTELSEFNGALQLNNVPLARARKVASGKTVTPTPVTVAALLADFEKYEGTLLELRRGVLKADQGNWAFNTEFSDGTGTVNIFTYAQASFANDAPTTDTVTIVAYANEFNSPQLVLRTLADVTKVGGTGPGGGGGGGPVTPPNPGAALTTLTMTFEGLTKDADLALPGWVNFNAVASGRKWRSRIFNDNTYAELSAFRDTEAKLDAWLITPALDFSKGLKLSFRSSAAFQNGDLLSVLVSTDYDGAGDPSKATWTPVKANLPDGSLPNYTFVDSGVIDLSSFTKIGYVAFRYNGSGPDGKTTTYQVDDVTINP